MIGFREFELRLSDDNDRVFLVMPMIAGSQEEALLAAQAHVKTHAAANFTLSPQLASVGSRAPNADSAEADRPRSDGRTPHA